MAVLSEGRIRIGITGLAVVFLMVLIGSALTGGGEREALEAQEERLANEQAPPAEALTEMGAAPGGPQETAPPADIDPIPVPIDPATEELIVNEVRGPDAG